MGLDMYLEKEVWVGGQYEHSKVTGTVDISIGGVKLPIPLNKVQEITLAVGYWRKANQVHKWFVENVQEGEDNCARYHVSVDKLKELLAICEKIQSHPKKAKSLLPTEGGFFFGSTGYNEDYMEDIDNTVDIINMVLKDEETLSGNYYYQSSW